MNMAHKSKRNQHPLVLTWVPIIVERVTILTCDRADFHASKAKFRVIRNFCDTRRLPALCAGMQVRRLCRLTLQLRNSRFKRFNPSGQLFEPLPDGRFIKDFQNV